MKIELQRIWLEYKSMKWWSLIPLLLIYGFLCPYQWNMLQNVSDIEEIRTDFFHAAQTIIPLSSLWWPLLCFRNLTEGEIMEVTYAADHLPKFRFLVYLTFIYQLCVSCLYVWYVKLCNGDVWEILRLLIQCLTVTLLFYCLTYCTHSALLAMVITYILQLLCLFIINSNWEWNLFASNIYAEDLGVKVYTAWTFISLVMGGFVLRNEKRMVVYC